MILNFESRGNCKILVSLNVYIKNFKLCVTYRHRSEAQSVTILTSELLKQNNNKNNESGDLGVFLFCFCLKTAFHYIAQADCELRL